MSRATAKASRAHFPGRGRRRLGRGSEAGEGRSANARSSAAATSGEEHRDGEVGTALDRNHVAEADAAGAGGRRPRQTGCFAGETYRNSDGGIEFLHLAYPAGDRAARAESNKDAHG